MRPVIDLDQLTLKPGGHTSLDAGACLLEAVSYIAGEPWSDHPTCVSPVLGAYGRALNDRLLATDRQKLKPYIPALIGTRTDDPALDDRRAALAADWTIRTVLPRWLELAGDAENANFFRAIPPIVTTEDARQYSSRLYKISDAMWAKRRASRAELQEKIKSELAKRGVTAAAAAAAADAADAVAVVAVVVVVVVVVVAVVVAVVVVVVVAVVAVVVVAVVAAADAVAVVAVVVVAAGSTRYWKVYDAVYAQVRKDISEGIMQTPWVDAVRQTNTEAIELLGRMIEVA
jgi:hypothetical protein